MENNKTNPGQYILRFNSGATYKGELIDGKIRHGFGVMEWADGTRYSGEWRNDMFNGRGKLYHYFGDIYDGDWKDNKAHGKGKYT